MTYENFTIKAQDAILRAQEIATNLDQQIVDSCHLAKAVIEVDEKLAEFIFSKLAVNVQKLKHELDTAIRSVPKVQGGGKQYLSNDANQILVQAKKLMPEFGDEYISLELILMAIAKVQIQLRKYSNPMASQRRELNKASPNFARKKVTEASSDENYNALNKYAVNFNAAAAAGKLDPIIGRDEEIRRILHILSRRKKIIPSSSEKQV